MSRRFAAVLMAAAVVFSTGAVGSAAPPAPPGVPVVTKAVVVSAGLGFDACEAPPTSVLRAWLASPFRSVNIYFGGSQRACADQPELSQTWVATVLANGWKLIPTYVGLQAPCSSSSQAKMS